MSSSRNEPGRQKFPDRETTEQAKQVKPAGIAQSAEPFPARDNEKSDAGDGLSPSKPTWEAIFERGNMLTALKRVESNKGAAGIDRMGVKELRGHLKAHWLEVREALESGKYRPSPVRQVEIPKPDGGVRQLGIPTVQDRLIQQAIAQVISPDVRRGVFTIQLRVSTRAECAPSRAEIPGVHPRRLRMGGGHRPGEVL